MSQFTMTKEELLEIFPVGAERDAQFYWEKLGKPNGKEQVMALLRKPLPAPVASGEISGSGSERSALLALRAVFAKQANTVRGDNSSEGIERLAEQFDHVTTQLAELIGYAPKGKRK